MLPNVLTPTANTYDDDHNNGQYWGLKLAQESYHTIPPYQPDFARPAKRVLHQHFTASQLRTKTALWFDEYYKAFQDYCTQKNEAYLTQAAPTLKERYTYGHDLWPQEIQQPNYILNILNNPPACITEGEEHYWAFIFANPPSKT